MKLKRNPRSHEQLRADQTVTADAGLSKDEFTYTMDSSAIVFPCQGGRFDVCIIRITRDKAEHPLWHWDCDLEEPTITPSIGCEHRCGWHGNLTKGEVLP